MARGERADGRDAVAAPLPSADAGTCAWSSPSRPTGEKPLGSTEAMEHTARTSPFYAAWVAASDGDLAEARAAIAARDLARLGAVAERSALRMHATALAADPAVIYWNPATLAAIEAIARPARARRAAPTSPSTPARTSRCCARPRDAAPIADALAAAPGVLRTIVASPGRARASSPNLPQEPA